MEREGRKRGKLKNGRKWEMYRETFSRTTDFFFFFLVYQNGNFYREKAKSHQEKNREKWLCPPPLKFFPVTPLEKVKGNNWIFEASKQSSYYHIDNQIKLAVTFVHQKNKIQIISSRKVVLGNVTLFFIIYCYRSCYFIVVNIVGMMIFCDIECDKVYRLQHLKLKLVSCWCDHLFDRIE